MYSVIISGIIALSLYTSNGKVHNGNMSNPSNERAIRHFKQYFKETSGERWTTGNTGYRVSFIKQDVKHVVDYHSNGRWRNTIRIYGESELPEEVRRNIKVEFLDSDIMMATELHFEETLAYFVKIRHNGWTKNVKVIDTSMEVIEEFEEQ